MSPISYTSDQAGEFADALTNADTLDKLRALVLGFREVASDAYEIVRGMSEDDFAAFRAGLARERTGEFAGEKFARRYGALYMPATLFRVSVVAQRFGVPWGCAYLRLKETGNLRRALA